MQVLKSIAWYMISAHYRASQVSHLLKFHGVRGFNDVWKISILNTEINWKKGITKLFVKNTCSRNSGWNQKPQWKAGITKELQTDVNKQVKKKNHHMYCNIARRTIAPRAPVLVLIAETSEALFVYKDRLHGKTYVFISTLSTENEIKDFVMQRTTQC